MAETVEDGWLTKSILAQHLPGRVEEFAQIEGTNSEATRFHGLRNARYRGNEGHQRQFYLTGAALNVNRLARAIRKRKEEAKTEH